MVAKRAVAASLALGERQTIVPNLLTFTYVANKRGAMGLFGDNALALAILAAAVLGMLWFALRTVVAESALAQVGFGALAGGALGNAVDRLVHGYVIDFIALPHFYVFNVADAAVAFGLALIAVGALVSGRRARTAA